MGGTVTLAFAGSLTVNDAAAFQRLAMLGDARADPIGALFSGGPINMRLGGAFKVLCDNAAV